MFYTSGKRADNAYGLFDEVGRIVRRTDKAVGRARASTARRGVSFTRRAVLDQFNIRSGQLTGKLRVVTTGDTIRVFASERPISLIHFGGRWSGRKTTGATAEIERGKRETYPGAFISTIQGRRAIRVRKKRGSKRVHRGPVQMLHGPSPREMVNGTRRDAETGSPVGRYPGNLREITTQRLADYYITELRRQYQVDLDRGR